MLTVAGLADKCSLNMTQSYAEVGPASRFSAPDVLKRVSCSKLRLTVSALPARV